MPNQKEDKLWFILVYFDSSLPHTDARYTALTKCDDGQIYEKAGFSSGDATQRLVKAIGEIRPKIKSVCIPALEVAGVKVRQQDGKF